MGKIVGFTFDLKEEHQKNPDFPDDALAELDIMETINDISKAIESGGHKVELIGNAKKLLKRIEDLGVDIVFNLCEGIGTRNRESEVPVILDLYKIPYVGSDGLTLGLTLDKVMAKKAFISDGVLTPKYFVAEGNGAPLDFDSMKFPFIVKPRHEGSSKGISQESIVSDRKELRTQVALVRSRYRQPALVEEFIKGPEFTVLVIGNKDPQALEPVQIKIAGNLEAGDLIYTSRRLEGTDIEYICPAGISASLKKKLCEMSVQAYRAVDCRDFGRVDIRVDKKGRPYCLEINPLPSLSTEDIFPMVAKASGITYDQLVAKIIDIALQRHGLS